MSDFLSKSTENDRLGRKSGKKFFDFLLIAKISQIFVLKCECLSLRMTHTPYTRPQSDRDFYRAGLLLYFHDLVI